MVNRREAMVRGAAAAGGALFLSRAARAGQGPPSGSAWAASYSGGHRSARAERPGEPGRDYTPCITPNGETLAFTLVEGVKVFHLRAGEVRHTFVEGLEAKCWGYNGRVHGPTIEAVEGDHVRIYVTNELPAPTTVHFHGVFLANGMDGVSGLTQRAIEPGETFRYEWIFRQHGTFMYHSHHDEMTQMALGMMGMLVVHPRRPSPAYAVERDYAIMLSEWRIDPGTSRPNPNEMNDFNVLTMNAKAYPATESLVCKKGDRVRVRFGNLSAMDHHPIHLHGHYFKIVATEGGPLPLSAQWPASTVLVPTGSTRDIEFIADAAGDWPLHCHMTHHVMNQMGHGLPNPIGMNKGGLDGKMRPLLPGYMTMGESGMGEMTDMPMAVPANSIPMSGGKGPFGAIAMGGMFTLLKVRDERPPDHSDPGFFEHPPGTVADLAHPDELQRDGVNVRHKTHSTPPASLRYHCPMHPEVVQSEPGTCPKCGMKLVPEQAGK